MMRIYIGHDPRFERAYRVAAASAEAFGHETVPVYEDRLRASGMLTRPTDRRGQTYDLNSAAPQSTDFAISRFFVGILHHSGWCLFGDSDTVCLRDPDLLLEYADPSYAVCVVKHGAFKTGAEVAQHAKGETHITRGTTKMDGQPQTVYPRKLWSSVMLWNCDHPANRRLTLTALNQWPGRDLHAFAWLADSEIGALPVEANWLVGIQPMPDAPIIAHYTLGTPDLPGFEDSEHAELWREKEAALCS